MTTPDNIVPFTLTDVTPLLGEVSAAAGDDEFMHAFMNTFLQRPGGPPASGPPVAVTLVLDINIVCFDGIPAAKKQQPTGLRTIPFSKRLKFPVGALIQLGQSRSFATKFPMYVYEGNKDEAVAEGTKKCNCCGAYADGFVTGMTVKMPEGTADVFSDAYTIKVNPAYPACKNTGCNQRLRKYMEAANGANLDTANDVAMCANDACRKVEELAGRKFQKCSRCHIRCYCSKECQAKDWRTYILV